MDQDHPKGLCENLLKYFTQQKAGSSLERTIPKFPNIVYKCLFTFKGGYVIEIQVNIDLDLLIKI